MSEKDEFRAQRWMLQGIVSELPQESRERVDAMADQLRAILLGGDEMARNEARIALALVSVEQAEAVA